jgi:hypothetical protein
MNAAVAITSEVMVERLQYRAALEHLRDIVTRIEGRGVSSDSLTLDVSEMKAVLLKVGVPCVISKR